MARNPSWYAARADSPEGFLAFLAVLREHRAAAEGEARQVPAEDSGVGPGGWENWTIAEFLEALEAYAQDVDLPAQPDWAFVARLLLAGKGYE